jgi:hypothetical protein
MIPRPVMRCRFPDDGDLTRVLIARSASTIGSRSATVDERGGFQLLEELFLARDGRPRRPP